MQSRHILQTALIILQTIDWPAAYAVNCITLRFTDSRFLHFVAAEPAQSCLLGFHNLPGKYLSASVTSPFPSDLAVQQVRASRALQLAMSIHMVRLCQEAAVSSCVVLQIKLPASSLPNGACTLAS